MRVGSAQHDGRHVPHTLVNCGMLTGRCVMKASWVAVCLRRFLLGFVGLMVVRHPAMP